MKKISSLVIGFVLICIGIAALAGQTPVLGIHPAVWFILGVGLMLSDSAWERLARAKRDANNGAAPEDGTTDDADSTRTPDAVDDPETAPRTAAASDAEPAATDGTQAASSADAASSTCTSSTAAEATTHKD